MTSPIESQINPIFLNFKSKQMELAYGAWGIGRLKATFYGALLGSAVLSLVIFGLQTLLLGRIEWVPIWVNLVIAPINAIAFMLVVRTANVHNRSQLDLWGGLFVAIGQIGQFWIAIELPELGGHYLMVNVLLANVGNSAFTSLNFRYIIPIVLAVLITFLLKIFFWDRLEASQLAYQSTMSVVFTAIGLTSGYLMERLTRVNFLHQTGLELKQQELLSKNKELEQFAYIASHDLQEPLRSVTSFSQLINEEYRDQMGKDGGQFLDYLMEASTRMRGLIKGLLDYSRLGREALFVEIDTLQCLNAVLVDLSTAIAERGAQVTHDALPRIVGYEIEFRQLLQNLLGNAIKFQRADLAPIVHVGVQKVGTFWEFVVADNGIGIPAEYHERIFLIFQRLHTRDKYEGTGIGLANCRKIAELHGGTMRVESVVGKGSKFYFTIPMRSAQWVQN